MNHNNIILDPPPIVMKIKTKSTNGASLNLKFFAQHSKGNHMRKNICKWYTHQVINLHNLHNIHVSSHEALQQKDKQPNQ